VCPTLQVLHISTPGDAADVNPVIQFLPDTLQHPMVDSSHFSTQLPSSGKTRKYAMMTHYTLGEILCLLICSFLLCLSWLFIVLQSPEFPEGLINNPVYILSCAHISLEVNMSLIQITAPPQRTNSAPWRGAPQSFGTSGCWEAIDGTFCFLSRGHGYSESMRGSCFFPMSVIIHQENVCVTFKYVRLVTRSTFLKKKRLQTRTKVF
jgi:hypothetical protein